MNLPVELWMRVFEELDSDEYARSQCISRFNHELQLSQSSNEEAAVAELPPFEKRTWRTLRSFYAVNHNSRVAALKVRLTQRLLPLCKSPTKLYRPNVYGGDAISYSRQDRPYSPRSQDRLVIELFPWENLLAESIRTLIRGTYLKNHVDVWRAIPNPLCAEELRAARHVVLLPPLTYMDARMEMARGPYSPLNITKRAIERFWQENGITDGRVEVFR